MSKALLFVVAVALFGSAAATCRPIYNRQYTGGQPAIAGPTTVPTLSSCCTMCQNNPACTGFNYKFDSSDPVNSRHTCTQYSFTSYSLSYLYGSHFGYITERVSNISITGNGPSPTTTASAASQTTGFQVTPTNNTDFISCFGRREAGVDYWVGYINRTKTSTEAECCAGCANYTGCNAYSWGANGDDTCYYRAYRGGFHGTTLMNSGYRVNSTLPAATGFTCAAASRDANTDYWGPNLSQAMTGSESECCAVCQAYQGCGAYSWTQEDDVCYIKPYASNRHQSNGIFSGYTVFGAPASTTAAAAVPV